MELTNEEQRSGRRRRTLAGRAGFSVDRTLLRCGELAAACPRTGPPGQLADPPLRAPPSHDHTHTSQPHAAGALRDGAESTCLRELPILLLSRGQPLSGGRGHT